MKFVHIADMHFDTPFTALSAKENLGEIRRLEQRKVFKEIIEYIKENKVNYLFIAGDLYDHNYVRKSTIEYIDGLFKEIPNTKIFIAPGNHDPYVKNSYYNTYKFNKNVYIFKSDIKKYEDINANIYGMAFTDFYMSNSYIENLKIENSARPNILIMHGDLNGSEDPNGLSYNPILESKIKSLKFDYVAMGHVHKCNLSSGNNIIYPGSPISFGFDELGDHGMMVGEITREKLDLKFVKLDNREFAEIVLNVEKFNTKEDLIEHILDLNLDKKTMYKVVLVGKRGFEINGREILRVVSGDNILKIKDMTKIGYNLETLSKENTLRGIYIKEMLKKLEEGNFTREEIERAIEIGLEVM